MSACTFIVADIPLASVSPEKEYPLEINIDTGEVFDGGADDNFFLLPFEEVDAYSEKKYGVMLEWNYTSGRAERICDYIRVGLDSVEEVEFCRVWLGDWYWYEYEDRPVLHERRISAADLTVEDIAELSSAEIWNNKDKNRPSFYRLTITR